LLEILDDFSVNIQAASSLPEKVQEENSEKCVVYVDTDLEDLIPIYLENRGEDIAVVLKELDENNYEAIRTIGHKMKGSGGTYGLDFVSKTGNLIEQAAIEQEQDIIRKTVSELSHYLEHIEVCFGEGD
jgi:HPt (histidine-containing phosphotransfer) domain-containing protein